jgi:hypothetical protein
MGVRLHWLPEYGVGMTVYSGKITPQMLFDHVSGIDPRRAPTPRCWITYLDDSVDVSDVDLAAQLQIRDLAGAKFRESRREARLQCAMVCRSRLNRPHLSLWQACTREDPDHRSDSQLFESLKEACDWLDLDGEARRQVAALAEGRAEAVPAAKPEPLTIQVSAGSQPR